MMKEDFMLAIGDDKTDEDLLSHYHHKATFGFEIASSTWLLCQNPRTFKVILSKLVAKRYLV